MSIRTSPWPDGVPCWADLAAPDVDAAIARYAEALAWDVERGGEEYGGYAMCSRRGAAAAGIGPMPPGASPAWTLYFATGDADATARAVQQAGGQVLAAPFDVPGAGRMSVAQDPTGAVFGLWQASQHIGASLVNEPGGLVWEDLRSADPEAARAFYAAVFGFRYDPVPGSADGYTTFALDDGIPLGGMGPHADGSPGGPSFWLAYFAVEDADAAAAAISADGGRLLAGPLDTPYGRLAVVTDPTGATLAVMQTSGEGMPDRAQ
jgi:predicted enzyme related to lactoylglutathione lyase